MILCSKKAMSGVLLMEYLPSTISVICAFISSRLILRPPTVVKFLPFLLLNAMIPSPPKPLFGLRTIFCGRDPKSKFAISSCDLITPKSLGTGMFLAER